LKAELRSVSSGRGRVGNKNRGMGDILSSALSHRGLLQNRPGGAASRATEKKKKMRSGLATNPGCKRNESSAKKSGSRQTVSRKLRIAKKVSRLVISNLVKSGLEKEFLATAKES